MRLTATIDKAWAKQLDEKSMEAVLALGMYNRRAVLLYAHTNDWFWIATKKSASKAEREEAFWGFFIPYYSMWVSTLYVVYNGLRVTLRIDDKKLKEIVNDLDVNLLRKYRNSTFHFDTKLRSDAFSDYISKNGFIKARQLFYREDQLVRRMIKLLRHNSRYEQAIF